MHTDHNRCVLMFVGQGGAGGGGGRRGGGGGGGAGGGGGGRRWVTYQSNGFHHSGQGGMATSTAVSTYSKVTKISGQ